MSERVLGIDPSTRATGWAILEKDTRAVIAHGAICPKKSLNEQEKINCVYNEICNIIKEYGPIAVACEDQFSKLNAKTLKILSRLVGGILLACQQNGLTAVLYAPTHVKSVFSGTGKACKEFMIETAENMAGVSAGTLTDDEADAIGVAYTLLEEMQ
jgi:crossover junction endodeoxyribonuclease RuvC